MCSSRFRKLYHKPLKQVHVYNTVEKVSNSGSSRVVTLVKEDCIVRNNSIPKLKDYRLSDLLVTDNLKPVSSTILSPDLNALDIDRIDSSLPDESSTVKSPASVEPSKD